MIRRIHWAFDPYSDVSETWFRSLDVLKLLQSQNDKIEVIPTYFLGHDLIHWISNVTASKVESLKPIAEKLMRSHLKELPGVQYKEPQVVASSAMSLREDCRLAADFFFKNRFFGKGIQC